MGLARIPRHKNVFPQQLPPLLNKPMMIPVTHKWPHIGFVVPPHLHPKGDGDLLLRRISSALMSWCSVFKCPHQNSHWNRVLETRKTVQGLRALPALSENPGAIPRIHVVAHNCLQLQFQGINHPLLTLVGTVFTWCTIIHSGNTSIYINKRKEITAWCGGTHL